MASPVFVVLGSGPGIGISTAKVFAAQHFKTIVLVSRKADRLASDREAVIKAAGRDVEVVTYSADLTDLNQLRDTFKKIDTLGPLGAVFFNAARIQPSEILTTDVVEIEEDFRTTNIGLYVTAQWAVPLLKSAPGGTKPAFLTTSSALPEHPLPFLFSLSAVKASQQNMVMSLNAAFGEAIHFGIIKVNGGPVSPDEPNINPDNIARKTLELYKQEKVDGKWNLTIDVNP